MFCKVFLTAAAVALPVSATAATSGARPGDDKMTCAMIGRELQPGALAISGAMAPEQQRIMNQVNKRTKEGAVEYKRRSAQAAGCLAGAVATMGAANPCDAINAAEDAAQAAKAPRIAAEDRAMNSDMTTMMANMNRSMAGMDMARMQHIVALAEAKNCN